MSVIRLPVSRSAWFGPFLALVFAVGLALPLTADAPASCGHPLGVEDLAFLLEAPAEPDATPARWGEPRPRAATCSGDDCGCLDVPCSAQCAPGDNPCFTECRRQQLACSICCCTPPEYRPDWVLPYC